MTQSLAGSDERGGDAEGVVSMFYREAGQFKTTYAADMAIFPIRQDRIGFALILAVAFVVIPPPAISSCSTR